MDTRRRRIGLLTTEKTNIGDDFIREGVVAVLKSVLPGDELTFVAVSKHAPHTVYPKWHPIRWLYRNPHTPRRRTRPLRQVLERTLPPFGGSRFDSSDLIVQCGTPIIWNGCERSEWAKLIWHDVLNRLSPRVPIWNIGGGACFPWKAPPASLSGHSMESFVKMMLWSARTTTVRDRLTRSLFASVGVEVEWLACPAFLAGQASTAPRDVADTRVLINYMPGGGHYDFGQAIDAQRWLTVMQRVIADLTARKIPLLLVCHSDSEEAEAKRLWQTVPSRQFSSPAEYFNVCANYSVGIFNRLHAGVALAGLGIPSICIGTDTRLGMLEPLGTPAFFVEEAGVDRMQAAIALLVERRLEERRRLLALRDTVYRRYQILFSEQLAGLGGNLAKRE